MQNHLVWTGLFLSGLFWLIESVLHCYFVGGSFLKNALYPDGHELWMRLLVVALLSLCIFYGRNAINRIRQFESALVEREKETQQILEENPAAIILVDDHSNEIVYANNNAGQLISLEPRLLPGRRMDEFLFTTGPEIRGPTAEGKLHTPDGKVVPVLRKVTPIRYRDKSHLLQAFFDITPQKKIQQELRRAHSELQQIFQTASVGMRLIDRHFNIVKINQTFSRMTGVAQEEAIGRKCFDVFAGSMCHSTDCPLQVVLDGRELREYEVRKSCVDGSVLICSLTVTRFVEADGNVGIVEAFKDITEFRNIQTMLQSERDLLHRILFQQLEWIGIVNGRYHLEYQNEVLKNRTGGKGGCWCYEAFRNKKEPCPDCLMQKAIQTEKIQRCEYDNDSGNWFQCTYTPFAANSGEKKVLVSCRDITESKNSIAAALHSERLAELGELAAGVAHEINNPINGIINYAQIMANKAQPGEQMHTIARRIVGEGDRIAGIVASLLSFSRQESGHRCLISVKDLLQETLTLTGAQLRKDGIALSVNLPSEPVLVFAVAQEIEQVFLNIINNSRYALNAKYPQGGKMKKLIIESGVHKIVNGTIARTSFTDYGTGISAGIIEKVCNPFFSTKPRGKGTGLGLTICRKIIDTHGGRLSFESTDGECTRVVVDLPVLLPN